MECVPGREPRFRCTFPPEVETEVGSEDADLSYIVHGPSELVRRRDGNDFVCDPIGKSIRTEAQGPSLRKGSGRADAHSCLDGVFRTEPAVSDQRVIEVIKGRKPVGPFGEDGQDRPVKRLIIKDQGRAPGVPPGVFETESAGLFSIAVGSACVEKAP